jgi:hypothetical protein
MLQNQIQPRRNRLPGIAQFSDTDKRAKGELVQLLTMGQGEDVLRWNIRRSNVKLIDHLIRLVRRDPCVARRVALCLLGTYGASPSFDLSNKVALCITETDAECRENHLEAMYAAGLCDSSEKAKLAAAITEHITALEALRDCVAADLHGQIPTASL